MIIQRRKCSIYFQSQITQIRLWHYRFGYRSNAKIIQASKLVDGTNLKKKSKNSETDNIHENQLLSSDSKTNKYINSDLDKPTIINKATNINIKIAKLYDTYIESKHIRIVKAKRMTAITHKLQEIYADLWGRTTHLYSQAETILPYFLMNLSKSLRFFY